MLGWSPEKVTERTRAIRDTLRMVFEDARANNVSTEHAARRLAFRRIEAGAESLV